MTAHLPTPVDLLERALGYTRDRLLQVRPDALDAPTPCADWDLHDLLTHMDDALDAFLEGAGGEVSLRPRPVEASAADLCTRLQVKACALVDVWRTAQREGRRVVEVGGHPVPAALLVNTAALEITVHGWDVGQATGEVAPIPPDLAGWLRTVALAVVTPADRGHRFAPPVWTAPGSAPDQALLAHLGRSTTPPGQSWRIPRPESGAAS